jgi:hypothetical protein
MTDLNISGSTYSIECWCSRWDVQDYSLIVEAWLKKSDLNTLRTNLRPGAVSELFQILGRPFYVDKSWTAANTLGLFTDDNSPSTLKSNRKNTLIYVKNLSTSPVDGPSGWISCKIEGYVSGNVDL